MNLRSTIARWLGIPTGYRASAEVSTSGRPSYVGAYGAQTVLPRNIADALLTQFRQTIPALKRAVAILSGLAGEPEFTSANDALAEDLNSWARQVPYGYVSAGLTVWLRDHLAEALTYGFAVGEAQIAPARNEVERLWSYPSSTCAFRAGADGVVEVLQTQGGARKTLNLERLAITSHDPRGASPQGESLFFALPTVCRVWQDVLHAVGATWRRNGIPTFHINWGTPDNFEDPDGSIASDVRSDLEIAWNAAMKSQVMDGRAKDYFSTGAVTVKTIGADGQVLDFQVAKRQIVEEIVVATGIPPWMLGYSWSTTERLSQQQADMLVSTVDALRREVEPAIRKLVELRQRLAARKGDWDLQWPAVNLQDAKEQAMALFWSSRAELSKQQFALGNWQAGWWNQAQAGEYVTGSPDVDTPMDSPPVVSPAPTGGASVDVPERKETDVTRAAREREMHSEYPELWKKHEKCGCKISADDPAQLWPNERPQYEQLERSVLRAWRATQAAFAPLKTTWLREVRATARRAMKAELPPESLAAIETAKVDFLAQFAGQVRTVQRFAASDTPDGILQQAEVDAWHAGTERAGEQLRWPMNPKFTAQQREALLRTAFERMSEDGKLRFEGRLDEIQQRMLDGFSTGQSPLAIARQLSTDLDTYERYRLGMIVRTEMGLASEAGIRALYRDAGVTGVDVIGDPNTDALCTSRIGKRFAIDDEDNLPLYHPYCGCSLTPVLPEIEE